MRQGGHLGVMMPSEQQTERETERETATQTASFHTGAKEGEKWTL